jgi:CBS-domain-containing membrane protein
MTTFLSKFKGSGDKLPPKASARAIMLAGLGGFIAIAAVASMTSSLTVSLIMGSFGASCLLLFGFPDVPLAQPRNTIGGHFLSSLVGLVFLYLLGPHWWTPAVGCGCAISLMIFTRTPHPPAAANPVIIYMAQPQPDWSFLLFPTLFGAVILTLIAVAYNNATREGKYPKYWF